MSSIDITGCDIDYAPLIGFIIVRKAGKELNLTTVEHTAAKAAFLAFSTAGKYHESETITYGHPLFHGHRGLVYIYKWNHDQPQNSSS